MKKSIILLLFTFLFLSSSTASDNNKPELKIKFGAEGGLNISRIIYYNAITGKPQQFSLSQFTLTWHAGGYASLSFNEKFMLQPELLYTVQGDRIKSIATVHINYIETPIELHYNVGKRFFILGGPYFSIYLSESSNAVTTYYSNSSNPINTMQLFDIGALIGAGLKWDNGLHIGLKYSEGFYDIAKRTIPGTTDLLDPEYTMGFSVFASWTFVKFKN